MIRYSLRCDRGHAFESWFKSADAFDKLVAAGLTECAVCGSTSVKKALMAPQVTSGRHDAPPRSEPPAADSGASAEKASVPVSLSDPAGPIGKAMEKLRAEIEKNADYVGNRFVEEARRMHDGDAPERPIYGEARVQDARALTEEGVPVLPLPFVPRNKTN